MYHLTSPQILALFNLSQSLGRTTDFLIVDQDTSGNILVDSSSGGRYRLRVRGGADTLTKPTEDS